jgi:bacillithiol biosynthesis deacetylase BshB1
VCAHPDDAELGCAGLLLRCKAAGARVGVVDLTRGELGSRGNAALRNEERARATAVLGLDVRLDLDLPDGFVERTAEYRTWLVEVIRSEQPRMLVGPYWEDHHPDHVNTSLLMKDAWWFAGVAKHPGGPTAHRPEAMLFQLSRYVARPSLIVDISEQFATKARAVACYASQLHRPPAADGPPDADGEPETYLSRSDFLAAWEGRHRYYGRMIGAEFGEAYLMRNPVPITDPMTLLAGRPGVM